MKKHIESKLLLFRKAKSMSSPWKTPERPQAQSFRELMQEQKEDEVNNAEDRDIAMAIKLSMEDSLSVEQRYIRVPRPSIRGIGIFDLLAFES